MLFTLFVDAVMYSIPFSSLVLFLKCGMHQPSAFILGICQAAYSLGVLLGSPMAGWWYTKYGRAMPPTTGLIVVFMVGSLLYTCAVWWWVIAIARFIVGIGDSNQAVARAYIARTTYFEERRTYMGLASGLQALGFVVGPLLGTAGVGIDLHLFGPVYLNAYTAPGFFALPLGIINIILVVWAVKDYRLNIKVIQSPSQSNKKWNQKGYIIACLLWLYMMMNFAVVDTLFAEYVTDAWNWNTTKIGWLLFGPASGTAFLGFVMVEPFTTKWMKSEDRRTVLFADLLCTVAFILWINPWVYPLPGVQLYAGLLIFFVGFPFRFIGMLTWISKTLDGLPGKQPLYMSLLSSVGSTARMLGPLWGGFMYNQHVWKSVKPSSLYVVYTSPLHGEVSPMTPQCDLSRQQLDRTGLYVWIVGLALELIGIVALIGSWHIFASPRCANTSAPPTHPTSTVTTTTPQKDPPTPHSPHSSLWTLRNAVHIEEGEEDEEETLVKPLFDIGKSQKRTYGTLPGQK
eukprot:NODE_71_length_1739_cov_458.709057_g70_i0.p1 GENE.NODE_71_length_1739_cov_458.709057_g70_i0~~NODE_71_length_1739_cov_458.709057_g70_i0.p1  ORF type:complete len:549 (+),score=109.96 NODE_71_length_1739_cov_458.709057_g70_i0:108-1649(+)